MATRTLIIDLSKGTGGEPMYGIVTVQRTRATSEGTFEVLPWETKLKLHNGVATITEAVTDGPGPFYDSAYLIRVQNGYCAPRWGFMAALPDGTTPISTGDMPKVNPITGEGIYMDAQEWNALYGTLPDRVTSLENSQSVQDGKIATLQTGKANTVHTHVIGDVTGLQPALNAKGNATMRVDTSVGTRVFITDGVTERMISGDTGKRYLGDIDPAVASAGKVYIRRVNSSVTVTLEGVLWANKAPGLNLLPAGLPLGSGGFENMATTSRPLLSISDADIVFFDNLIPYVAGSNLYVRWVSRMSKDAFITTAITSTKPLSGSISWDTTRPWPTTLPGTPA